MGTAYVLTLDFETLGIQPNSPCTPRPIGVAWKINDEESQYLPYDNYTNAQAYDGYKRHLQDLIFGAKTVIGHNLKFDLRVMEEHFHIKISDPSMIEDTMILHFLFDPNVEKRGLKDASVHYLDRDPDERDELKEWLMSPEAPIKCVTTKTHHNYYMKHLDKAPVELVAKYAKADVDMTYELYQKLYPFVNEHMSSAYHREKSVMLCIITMEQTGIRIDYQKLTQFLKTSQKNIDLLHKWICERLGKEGVNLDSPAQLATALQEADLLDMTKVTLTNTGQISTKKEFLEPAIVDPLFCAMYSRYKEEVKCCSSFLFNWWSTAYNAEDKTIILYPSWNTVGTRTGRFTSTSPNFQNIPSRYKRRFKHEFLETDDAIDDAITCPIPEIGSMPNIRSLILPRYEGHSLISIDYSQQELRILAYFEDDALLKMYQDDPHMDIHSNTQKLLSDMLGKEVTRKQVKELAFGITYCMGVKKLADKLNSTYDEAKMLKDAYMNLYPGLKQLNDQMRYLASQDDPLVTLGGRLCKCEPMQQRADGTWQDLSYKMVNYACQGSGADALKKAIVEYVWRKPWGHLLYITVYDQLIISVPKGDELKGYNLLKKCMESVPCDAKLIAEGDSTLR